MTLKSIILVSVSQPPRHELAAAQQLYRRCRRPRARRPRWLSLCEYSPRPRN